MPGAAVVGADGRLETVAYHKLPALLLNELQKQQAVIAALRGAVLSQDDVKTDAYTIEPEMQYEEATRRSRVVGYIARITVSAEVRELERMGRVIDAGANIRRNEVNSAPIAPQTKGKVPDDPFLHHGRHPARFRARRAGDVGAEWQRSQHSRALA